MKKSAVEFAVVHFITFVVWCCLGQTAYSQAHEYGLPVESLGRYEIFREVMLRHGFEPITMLNHVEGYTEIVCSNTICGADWVGPDKAKYNFTIWFEYLGGKQIFYLAPQVD